AFCLENKPTDDLSWLSAWSVVAQTFRNSYQRLAALPGCEVEVEILERKADRGRFVANPALAHLEANWPRAKPFESRSAVPAEQGRSTVARCGNEPTANPSQEGTRQDAAERLQTCLEGPEVGMPMERPPDCSPGLQDTLRV